MRLLLFAVALLFVTPAHAQSRSQAPGAGAAVSAKRYARASGSRLARTRVRSFG